MITLSTRPPFVQSVPDVLRPFRKAGKVDSIFRPRIVGNGVFATSTGYGVSFSIGGIDSEGLGPHHAQRGLKTNRHREPDAAGRVPGLRIPDHCE